MTIRIRIAALAGAIALACSAGAQQAPDQDQSYQAGAFDNVTADSSSRVVDPPSRVARLAYLSGDVSFAPAGENDWSRAQRNRPMVTGDKLYTDAGGRAELQVGASIIHVDQHTSMDFLNLNDQTAQVELTQGALNLDVRRLRSGEVYEVDTPTIAFVADRIGDYRIDVDSNGQTTTVSIRRGSGEAIGEGGKRVRIEEGQSVVFNDAQLNDYHNLAQRRSDDGFDTYAAQRSERYDRGVSRNYVSEDVVGYEDLDDNGSWEDAPDYGHVWYPTHVATDWAPYHDGNWDWVEPYGWTWVDNASWGFAPFHYGRWAYIGSRWGWVPGPVDVRPVYAPALVAFVGGGGFGVDISIGGPIGWFALGPGDVYFPGYRCGRDYFNSVNISNTVVNNTVVNNYYGAFSAGNVNYAQISYANRMAPRAMTAVPATTFASGRPVAASAIAVNRTMLTNARILPRATVAPTAASLVANRGRAMAPPAAVRNRSVVAANRPAPVPAPFAQRQALLRKNPPGQPLTAAQMRTVASANARGPAANSRSNVRVAGAAAATATAPNANARANARATANAPGTANNRAATTANARNGQLRSSGFAHGSNVPRESATAQQHASPNARFERGTARPTPQPRESTTAQQHASANARFERGNTQLRSSGFAHGGNAPRESVTTQQHASTNARVERGTGRPTPQPRESVSAQQRASANARIERSTTRPVAPRESVSAQNRTRTEQRGNVNANARVRSNAYAAHGRATEQRVAPTSTRANEHVQTRMSERAQTQIRTPQPAERAQVQSRTPERAPQRSIVREAPRMQPQVREQAHAQAQYRAPERIQPQVRVQPRAQAQYREPQRPTSQRQQTPQQREAKRKDEKRDQNGGG